MLQYENHEFKLQLDMLNRLSRQETLKERLVKMCKDRQYRRQKAQEDKDKEVILYL